MGPARLRRRNRRYKGKSRYVYNLSIARFSKKKQAARQNLQLVNNCAARPQGGAAESNRRPNGSGKRLWSSAGEQPRSQSAILQRRMVQMLRAVGKPSPTAKGASAKLLGGASALPLALEKPELGAPFRRNAMGAKGILWRGLWFPSVFQSSDPKGR